MLPPLGDVAVIHDRLQTFFPDGSPRRAYCVREMAARTVFVMLYVGAIQGVSVWIGPKHVVRMSDIQAADRSDAARRAYAEAIEKPGSVTHPDRWYQDNTREPIRDETLREGLVRAGAVVVRPGLPTTSAKPRYALQPEFAALFHPELRGELFRAAVAAWQDHHLSAGALARVRLRGRAAAASGAKILVALPNGETRQMEAGASSVITKAVVEVFAKRFLTDPAVVWISESGNKVVQRDERLASDLGLRIESDRLLPDIILVDLAPADPLVVFVEVVASDGPMTASRRDALLDLLAGGGVKPQQAGFVTAFADRDLAEFRRSVSHLAWGSFAWCFSEPDHLIAFDGRIVGGAGVLSEWGER